MPVTLTETHGKSTQRQLRDALQRWGRYLMQNPGGHLLDLLRPLLECTSRVAAVSVRDSRSGGMQVHQGSSHPPFRAAPPGVRKHLDVRMLSFTRPSVAKHICQTYCRQNVRRHTAGRMFVGILMFVVPLDDARWRIVRAAGMQVHRGSPHPPLRPRQTPLYTTHPDHHNPVS